MTTPEPFSATSDSARNALEAALAAENARLRQQAAQLAIVEERNRLARELHDSVTQSLYSASLFATAAQRVAATGDLEQTQQFVAEVALTTQQALKEMRLLVHKLRPSLLEEQGLVAALQHRLRAVEGRAGVSYGFSAENLPRYSHALEDAAFFIVQEALNNALRHAMADHVTVHLAAQPDSLHLTISDNGCGFDTVVSAESGGLGLTSMRERATGLNGNITIRSTTDETQHGTIISVTLIDSPELGDAT
jgi:signal transduction histidine kinase